MKSYCERIVIVVSKVSKVGVEYPWQIYLVSRCLIVWQLIYGHLPIDDDCSCGVRYRNVLRTFNHEFFQ